MSETLAKYNVILQLITEQKGDIKKIKKEATGLQKTFNMAKGAFAGIIAANVVQSSLQAIKGLVSGATNAAKVYEQTAISFEVFTGSATKAKKLLDELEEFSLKTPFTPEQVQSTAKTLLGFGRNVEEVKKDIELLGNVSAATSSDLGQLGLVYGQVAGLGKLQGQDALQFINAGIPLYQILSESMGKSVAEVKKLQSEGKITFDVLRKGFEDASKEGGKFEGALIKQSKSFGGLLSTLQGVGGNIMRNIGQAFLPLLKKILPPLIELGFKFADSIKRIGKYFAPVIFQISVFVKKGIQPMRESFSKLFGLFKTSDSSFEPFKVVVDYLLRAFTVISKSIGFVVGGLADIFSFFKNSDNKLIKGFVDPIKAFFNLLLDLPSIIAGVDEAIGAISKNFANSFRKMVVDGKLAYEKIKGFFGANNDLKIAKLKLDKKAIEESYKSVIDAFKKGYDDNKAIGISLPKIDTDDNKRDAKDQGKEIGKELGKGITDGAGSTTDIKKIIAEEIEKLKKKTALQKKRVLSELLTEEDKNKRLELIETAHQLKILSIKQKAAKKGSSEYIELGNRMTEIRRELEIQSQTLDEIPLLKSIGLKNIKFTNKDKNAINKYITRIKEEVAKIPEKSKSGKVKHPFMQDLLGLSDKEYKKTVEQLEKIKNIVGEYYDYQINRIDNLIDKQQERVDKAEKLAEKGKVDQLRIEKARLKELTDERKKFAKQQQAIAQTQIITAQSVASADAIRGAVSAFKHGGIDGIVEGTAWLLALGSSLLTIKNTIGSSFADIPTFFGGTELISKTLGNRKISNGRDGYLVRADGSERIVPGATNSELGNFPNALLPQAVRTYKLLPQIQKSLLAQANKNNGDISGLKEEIRSMKESFEAMKFNVRVDKEGLAIQMQKMQDEAILRKKIMA